MKKVITDNNIVRNNRIAECPACEGTKKIKIIKNIAQFGKFYLGKEIEEECKFCKKIPLKQVYDLEPDTIN